MATTTDGRTGRTGAWTGFRGNIRTAAMLAAVAIVAIGLSVIVILPRYAAVGTGPTASSTNSLVTWTTPIESTPTQATTTTQPSQTPQPTVTRQPATPTRPSTTPRPSGAASTTAMMTPKQVIGAWMKLSSADPAWSSYLSARLRASKTESVEIEWPWIFASVDSTTVSGNTATALVTFDITMNGVKTGSDQYTYRLVIEHGQWVIDGLKYPTVSAADTVCSWVSAMKAGDKAKADTFVDAPMTSDNFGPLDPAEIVWVGATELSGNLAVVDVFLSETPAGSPAPTPYQWSYTTLMVGDSWKISGSGNSDAPFSEATRTC